MERMTADMLTWEQVGQRTFQGIHGAFTGLFTDMFLDTENAFQNFADNLLRIFVNMLAEMAAQQLMINISGLLGGTTGTNANTGINIPFGGIGNLIPDSVLNTALLTYGGVDGLTLGAASTIVTPAMEAAGLTAGTSITLGSILPYVGVAAGLFGLLGGGLLDDLFGSNAGFGFQTPETTAGFGQTPWTVDDFWVAEGSNGTSLEDMAEITTALMDAVEASINETAEEIESLGGIMSVGVRDRFLEALDNITVTLPRFGINEENFSEMMGNVAGFVRDEMLRQAAPAIGDALAAQWGTDEWMSAIPAMSDDSVVRADYEALLVAYQKMRAEVEAYGQATVETVEEMIEAATTFNETLEKSTGWIKDGMADALTDAMAEDNLTDVMAAFRTNFRQTIHDAMLSGMIEAAINSAMLEPYMATFSEMLADAFAEPTVDAITEGLNAAVSYWDTEVQPRADLLAETLYNAVSGSSLADFLDTTTEQQTGLNTTPQSVYDAREQANIDAWWQKHAEWVEKMKSIRERIDASWKDPLTELEQGIADIRDEWEEIKETIRGAIEYNAAAVDELDSANIAMGLEIKAFVDDYRQTLLDELFTPMTEMARDAQSFLDTQAGRNDLFQAYQRVLEFLQANNYTVALNTGNIADLVPANMTVDDMEEFVDLLVDMGEAFFSILQDRWNRWETIRDQAEALLETMTRDFDASVLDDIPALDTSVMADQYRLMDRGITEESLIASEKYIADLTDWVNRAMQVRQQIHEFNKAVEVQKASLADSLAMSGLDAAGQSAYILEKVTAGITAMASMTPEDALAKARELTTLINQRYELEINQIENIKGLIDDINDKILELKYSQYNLDLPVMRAEDAVDDYKDLFDAAKTGTAENVRAYLDFIDTFLQQGLDAFASSTDYREGFFQRVLDDLETLGLTIDDLNQSDEAALLTETNNLLDMVVDALEGQDQTIQNAIEPHLQLISDALADGGHLDVIFGDLEQAINDGFVYISDLSTAINALAESIANSAVTGVMGSAWSATAASGYGLSGVSVPGELITQFEANGGTININGDLSVNGVSMGNISDSEIQDWISNWPQAAGGAVVSGPSTGYPVMAHNVEAIIPIRGGAIPVRFEGGGGGQKQTVVVQVYANGVLTTEEAREIATETADSVVSTHLTLGTNGKPLYARGVNKMFGGNA